MEDAQAMLGKRGQRLLNTKSLLTEGFNRCEANLYNADTNPNGCVNLGTSENRLVFDILTTKLNDYNVQFEDYMLTYNNFQGIREVREAVAAFLTDRAKAPTPLDPKQICILNGGGISMEALTFVICDPGDSVMVASPYYGGIESDTTMRPEAKVIRVHFYSKLESGQTEPFQIVMSKFESVYQEETAKGAKIRAVFFMNPNNPLGDVYSKEEILELLNFCNRHSLHLIMDEVYMNSIFKEGVELPSILGFRPDEIPDPQRLHYVWAASKDLSMSGMRFGIIHSQNNQVMSAISNFLYFQQVPIYIQKVVARLLSDRDWLNNVYFPINNKRLREAHKVTTDTLDSIGIPYLNRPSGLFVYADFRKFMPSLSEEQEMELFYRFIADGAYIAPSLAFHADERGWFRIIFSRPVNEVILGMERIAKTCQALLEENKKLCAASGGERTKEESASACSEGISLEGLLSQLKCEISTSNWLEKNTADQWKEENPELFNEYMSQMK